MSDKPEIMRKRHIPIRLHSTLYGKMDKSYDSKLTRLLVQHQVIHRDIGDHNAVLVFDNNVRLNFWVSNLWYAFASNGIGRMYFHNHKYADRVIEPSKNDIIPRWGASMPSYRNRQILAGYFLGNIGIDQDMIKTRKFAPLDSPKGYRVKCDDCGKPSVCVSRLENVNGYGRKTFVYQCFSCYRFGNSLDDLNGVITGTVDKVRIKNTLRMLNDEEKVYV